MGGGHGFVGSPACRCACTEHHSIPTHRQERVGALGSIRFRPGTYVYVGSAQRNLEKRMQRHLKQDKKLFWHIDYMLSCGDARVEAVFVKQAGKDAECAFAYELDAQSKGVLGFGCSDCTCRSHLFWFPVRSALKSEETFAPARRWVKHPLLGLP